MVLHLSDREQKFSITPRECLEALQAVTALCRYLELTCFTIRTDHEVLWCTLTIAGATAAPTRWRLILLNLKLYIVLREGRKRHAAGALPGLVIDSEPLILLENELPVFTASTKSNAYAPSTVKPDFQITEEPNSPFVRCIPEVGIMTEITSKEKAEILIFSSLFYNSSRLRVWRLLCYSWETKHPF